MSGANTPKQAATTAAPAPAPGPGLWMQVFRDSLHGAAAHVSTKGEAELAVAGAIHLADAAQAAIRSRRAAKAEGTE